MSGIVLTDGAGRLTPVIKILTDYPRDDLAHDEVHQSLVAACMKRRANAANIDVGAIPGMDTVVSGFKTAQLVMTSQLGYGHVFHANCAPRKNIVSVKSAGEKIVLGMTKTGVTLLAVNAGYTLALFRDAALAGDITFFQTSVPYSGSQFRSRDYFPDAVAELAVHLSTRLEKLGAEKTIAHLAAGEAGKILEGLSYLGAPLDADALPQMPRGAVMYVDNFGNMKLNARHADVLALYKSGEVLVVAAGNAVAEAAVGDVGFSHGEGVLALTAGSSGWCENGAFSELFLRGGRAESHFPGVRPGDALAALSKADFRRVSEALQSADRGLSDKLDLHNATEARLIQALARAGLIRDGFDSAPLRAALADKTLLAKLAA
jgi:hypothetical protein